MKAYQELFDFSIQNPEAFWERIAHDIHWHRRWDKVLDDSDAPHYRWFAGAQVNTCYNALDAHVNADRGDQVALIYDSAITGEVRKYTYQQLLEQTERFAGALSSLGVSHGSRVVIYMPMIPETAIAMLACARLGAIHSVVFGGFAAAELAVRIDDAKPTVVVSASCGLEPGRLIEYKPLLDEALGIAEHKCAACVIYQRPQAQATMADGFDHDWHDLMAHAQPAPCIPVAATDPLYILYTSGTTGMPKGVVRDNGGHIVSLKWTMKNIYGLEPGEVFWAASDVGWVVGHSYIIYAPLFAGNTTVLFEGKPVGTPDPGTFWRVISDHGVAALFTAPTAFRAIKKEDPNGDHISKYDLSCLRTLFLAGERTDPDTLNWARNKLNVPVIDHWWQTETGWAICANLVGVDILPVKEGSPTKPVPGWNLKVLDSNNEESAPDEIGSLVVKLPLPPGSFPTLWNAKERFVDAYLREYPGYYKTADAGYVDADGYVFVMSRTDDIINVAGHRLSTGAMEEALASHPDVAECAVTGVADDLKGQVPLGLLVLNSSCERSQNDIVQECIKLVRKQIGPVAAFKQAVVVKRLPKTRSGKILRGTIRKIADGEPWKMPATIDDPAILDEIADCLKTLGYPRQLFGLPNGTI